MPLIVLSTGMTTGSSAHTLPLWSRTHGRVPVSNVHQRYACASGGSATVTWWALASDRDC
jgi:hypothetical protein